ncbi:Hsp20/alpha crystallin family protein [Cohnella lubricantis]|uniref:Hsp20/alpha crystallin family protein n=1 Tax=Cohnella lubricantis TaxID=2163172 RepID=A0A841THK9_9BACL|nr:Hsp20/alpha crystallin family protein [Cohnella lubricantis]MBB6678437.1 Hsp20/alpha crystallin family protein [Cohnella lubricantis]MBP2116817.1 HSP20 family protein [Cohnella lubricantis]
MEQDRTNLPKDFYTQASEVLGEDFWQEIGELLPNSGPRIDIYYTQQSVVVLAELPGLQRTDQVKIQLRGQTIELEGEIPCLYPVTRNRISLSERFFGPFRRTLQLPKPVRTEPIKAKYAEGLLIVTFPIDEADRQTEIPIEFGAAGQPGSPAPPDLSGSTGASSE